MTDAPRLVRINPRKNERYEQQEKHQVKIRTEVFKNTSDFEGRKGSATLNMDRLSLFMDNMISNYNYPELAVLREWVSNAHDAHVAAGVKKPVKVTLPSNLSPTLIVQDFGEGMSTDFVENVYLDFGSSSKNLGNDQIGGFGIGGKSALAIASQYTMTTISQGLKSVYIFERSPKGGVDFKNPIYEIPTDEPSGVVVQVAVDRVGQFTDTNLNRVLAGWSNADISLNTGKEFFSIPDNSSPVDFELDFTDYSLQGQEEFEEDVRSEKGFVLHGALNAEGKGKQLSRELGLSWNEYVVLVGPVAYVFSPEGFNGGDSVRNFMVPSLNIGDVSFPSSREVIEPTRANRTTVSNAFEKITTKAFDLLQAKADGVGSRAEALTLHRSPLAQSHQGKIKISFKGEEVPTTFTTDSDREIYAYQHTGGWQGIKNYKLSLEEGFANGAVRTLPLKIQTLVILDDDSSSQSVRNNVRARHSSLGHKPKDLGGYLVMTKKANKWLKAAADTTITSSELAAVAKEHRRKEREAKAAAKAAGTAPTPAVKMTRRDRIGEYRAEWLEFSRTPEGKLEVRRVDGDLMEFHDGLYDPKKTLVMSTNSSSYSPEAFANYFETFSVDPQDAQFLRVHTGAKEETLRHLLGSEVTIMDFEPWMEKNFASLASYKGRTPAEISREIPFSLDSASVSLIKTLGVDTLHPKYAEFLKLQAELEEAEKAISENNRGYYYYGGPGSLMRRILQDFGKSVRNDRAEFFFLSSLGYIRIHNLEDREYDALRQTLNQMVVNWLDNLAMEEAEAEDAAEESAKAEAEKPLQAVSNAG